MRLVKHEGTLSLRLPSDLLDDLEKERRRVSRVVGVDVKTSAVVRSILERDLRRRRTASKTRRAAVDNSA